MSKLHINIGDSANDRTGDPLRTAFDKVNSNFDELYARTGDDIQIPALAGNNKKVLTTNGTTLSWGSTIANTGFDTNTVYNFNGMVIDNSDLEHGATALVSIPDNGEAVNPLLLQNNYGSAAVTVGTSPSSLKTWTFGTNGNLTLPGTGTISNPRVVVDPAGTIYTFATDYSGSTNGLSNALSIRLPGGAPANLIQENWIITFANGATKTVTTSINALLVDWDLFWVGELTIANGADVWPLTVQSADYTVGTTASSLELTPDGTTAWAFSSDGTLSSPNGSLQRNTAPVNCQGNASTVVYTSADTGIQTIKLLIQTEGIEGVGSIMDTQSCEMIVAKSFRANDIAASVYGIVYTSQAPLATFTAEWNAITSRVEVMCTTPGANGVNVKISATEISTSD